MGESNFHIAVAHNNGRLILIIICLAAVYNSNLAKARSVPRSNSRSFRFPSDNEEYHELKKNYLFFENGQQPRINSFHEENSQGRHAVISLDSVPIKASVPQSPDSPTEKENETILEEEALSGEVIQGGLDVLVDEQINDDSIHENESHQFEILREALCSTFDEKASSTNNSRNSGPTNSNSSNKIRYDLQAGKCAEVGTRGHCGENMIFVSDVNSAAYGYCECDFENKILRKERKQAALLNRTPLVYHTATNSCHRLYEQAYCNTDEWLVLSRKEKRPICEQNRCSTLSHQEKEKEASGFRTLVSNRRRASKLLTPSAWTNESSSVSSSTTENATSNSFTRASIDADDKSILVPLNGSGPCVKLFEPNSEFCEGDEEVVFNVGDIVPKCGIRGRGIEGRAIIRNACPPGSYYSIIGRCQPDWDF